MKTKITIEDLKSELNDIELSTFDKEFENSGIKTFKLDKGKIFFDGEIYPKNKKLDVSFDFAYICACGNMILSRKIGRFTDETFRIEVEKRGWYTSEDDNTICPDC